MRQLIALEFDAGGVPQMSMRRALGCRLLSPGGQRAGATRSAAGGTGKTVVGCSNASGKSRLIIQLPDSQRLAPVQNRAFFHRIKVAVIDGSEVKAYNNRAVQLIWSGDLEAARRDLNYCIELDRDDHTALANRGFVSAMEGYSGNAIRELLDSAAAFFR